MSNYSIYLEEFTEQHDFSDYLKLVNDKNNTYAIEGIDEKRITKKELIKFINKYDGILYGIFNEKKRHIGNLSFSKIDDRKKICNTGILLSQSYQGCGYAFQAMVLGLGNIFDNFNIDTVQLFVLESNLSAIRLYEKLGFQLQGVAHNQFFKNGQYKDSLEYRIEKRNFKYYP